VEEKRDGKKNQDGNGNKEIDGKLTISRYFSFSNKIRYFLSKLRI